ncbi:P-loop containing nucleoside triphosphate hydrolase protein, partial [Mycena vitilis]
LKKVFKIPQFRKNQLEAIEETMQGHDIFVLMPTGSGKSLCFQLPAVFQNQADDSLTVVVSPLRSLIEDQVQGLTAKGIKAVGLSSESDMRAVKKDLTSRQANPALLYCTPEKIQKSTPVHDALVHLHRQGKLARFAIDEAHCVAIWGEEFREAYHTLHTLRDNFPGVPIMALTSSATQKDVSQIIFRLKLKTPKTIRESLNRPNLNYTVIPKRHQLNDLIRFINSEGRHNKSGIIYRTGPRACQSLTRLLKKRGIKAKAYHAGLTSAERTSVQAEWKNGKCCIIVATLAFGMGIDKNNVRFIVHYDLPKSLENYYQETGRAGRDGQSADCVLFYSFRDKKAILDLKGNQSLESQARASGMVQYCEEKFVCRRVLLLRHFGEFFDQHNCGGYCDNCRNADRLVSRDLSTEARIIVTLVQTLQDRRENVSVPQCIQLVRGCNLAAARKNDRDSILQYGACRDLTNDLATLLFEHLFYLGVLAEYKVDFAANYHWYLKVYFVVSYSLLSLISWFSWERKGTIFSSPSNESP